jgi:hypothetical protein
MARACLFPGAAASTEDDARRGSTDAGRIEDLIVHENKSD